MCLRRIINFKKLKLKKIIKTLDKFIAFIEVTSRPFLIQMVSLTIQMAQTSHGAWMMGDP